jgi:hypothetical protein
MPSVVIIQTVKSKKIHNKRLLESDSYDLSFKRQTLVITLIWISLEVPFISISERRERVKG